MAHDLWVHQDRALNGPESGLDFCKTNPIALDSDFDHGQWTRPWPNIIIQGVDRHETASAIELLLDLGGWAVIILACFLCSSFLFSRTQTSNDPHGEGTDPSSSAYLQARLQKNWPLKSLFHPYMGLYLSSPKLALRPSQLVGQSVFIMTSTSHLWLGPSNSTFFRQSSLHHFFLFHTTYRVMCMVMTNLIPENAREFMISHLSKCWLHPIFLTVISKAFKWTVENKNNAFELNYAKWPIYNVDPSFYWHKLLGLLDPLSCKGLYGIWLKVYMCESRGN